MASTIIFPPADKCDFYLKLNDTLPSLTGYLRDAVGPIDLSTASSVKFCMRSETSSASLFSHAATIISDPTFTASGATLTAAAHALNNGDLVWVKSSGTLPAGLSTQTHYYVVQKTASTLKLATVKGGTPVTTTDAGTGTHTIIAGRAKYTFGATDVVEAGNYYGEFEVTFSGGGVETFPNNKWIFILALADAG